jgi:hypothetical protein
MVARGGVLERVRVLKNTAGSAAVRAVHGRSEVCELRLGEGGGGPWSRILQARKGVEMGSDGAVFGRVHRRTQALER